MDAETLLRAHGTSKELAQRVRRAMNVTESELYVEFFEEVVFYALVELAYERDPDQIMFEDLAYFMSYYIEAQATGLIPGKHPTTLGELHAHKERRTANLDDFVNRRPSFAITLADLTAHAGKEVEFQYLTEIAEIVLQDFKNWWAENLVDANELESMFELEPEPERLSRMRKESQQRFAELLRRRRTRPSS